MGTDIIIKRTTSPTATFFIRHYQAMTLSLSMPVDVTPISESADTQAQLIKFFGNTTRIPIDWIIRDLGPLDQSVVQGENVKHSMAQLIYLYRNFQNVSTTEKFSLTLEDGQTGADEGTLNLVVNGVPTLFTATRDSTMPVAFRAHFEFAVGTVR